MMKNNLKRIDRVVTKMIKKFNLFDIPLQKNKKEKELAYIKINRDKVTIIYFLN